MIKIAVVDDEIIFATKMKEIISKYMDTHFIEYSVDIFNSGCDFTSLGIEMSKYDIIYLDINMQGLNGLETAAKMRGYCKESFVVFVTAYVEYTLAGYSVEAIRYILKDNSNLISVVEESIYAICRKMKYNMELHTFDFKEGKRKLPLNRIAYVESFAHTMTFHILENEYKRYHMRGALNSIADLLGEKGFIRIQQSYVVNWMYIDNIANYAAYLMDGTVLPISKSKYKEIRNHFISYRGDKL